MRKLAIFACACSAAVWAANFLLSQRILLPLGILCLLAAILVQFIPNRCRRLWMRLILCGGALGFLWTAVYIQIVLVPARALDGQTVHLSAVVAEWPQETDYGYSVLVETEVSPLVSVSTLLYVDEQGAGLRPGDEISTITYCTLADRTLAGEAITYYTAKGIFLRGETYGELNINRPDHIPVRYWAAVFSKALKSGVDTVFPEDIAPMIRALVTGNRENLTDSFTTSLQRTGLSHTVAVSGMHLAFLAGMAVQLFGRSRRSAGAVCLLVLLFCGVAGNTPSVIRAAVMVWMLQLAPLVDRERDSFTSLALALLLLLLHNPFAAANIGLQLSFGAVAGILLVSDPIQVRLMALFRLDHRPKEKWKYWVIQVPRFLVSTFASTMGASVLTIPLVAIHFRSVSLISPLANLLTLWAVAILFGVGLLLGTLGILLPGVSAVLAIPFTSLARYLDWVVELLGRLPMAAIPLDSFYYQAWVVYLCLLIGCGLLLNKEGRWIIPACGGTVALCTAMLFTLVAFRSGAMTAAVLDVGQGQSVLLRTGDYLALVDCGGDSMDNAGDIAADYIQAAGRSSLDFLILTHYHEDHANGVSQLLQRMQVSQLILPDVEEESPLRQEIITLAREKGVPITFLREDTRFHWGTSGELTLLAPLGQGTDTNELGLTVLASAGNFDVLITGDMGGEVEHLLLEHTELPDLELLVAGHHGSATSTTQELLQAVTPDMTAISVGEHNLYGHPAQETLERLAQSGTEIYRTDLQGTILVQAKG
ncbi:DNA internalization-related competence protein ComEC/Rec2 [Flavonifractor sp. An100]|uniref:DNA internalization-related competence protein ComEC/Rec2 n=1 Tax=Flavonifractor sp. An100 TaxID=1965538 RepID=UPI000B398C84|nr:DNA internalization-related competence protein ComEC/Rec2 [Flavonifractor sp. An100]OUQ80233.1 DNA internalization-related competence protein ComEC/Rec2 [Flavonifractor sp. An100]